MPSGPLVVAAPPVPPPPAPTGLSASLPYALPAAGALGSIALVLAGPPPLVAFAGLVLAGGSLLAGVWLALRQRSTDRTRRLGDRLRYLDHLDGVRREARETAQRQAASGRWRHPHPQALWQLADDPARLWERRPGDPDFLAVRVGLGRVQLARPMVREAAGGHEDRGREVDRVSEEAARRLIESSHAVDGQPLVVEFAETPSVAVVGPPEQAWSLARAMVAQIVAWHAPGEVRVAFVLSAESAALWTWVKWLPHVEHPRARDAEGPARLFATDPTEVVALLGGELRVRDRHRPHGGVGVGGHLVLVVDRGVDGPMLGVPELEAALADPAPLGVSVLHVLTDPAHPPSRVDLRVRIEGAGVVVEVAGETRQRGTPDQLSLGEAEVLGRRLGALSFGEERADELGTVAPADVLGFAAEQLDTSLTWKARPPGEQLRAAVGMSADGRPVHLDLKDAALGGIGPHGVCAGATGAGKTEFLRAVVVALAATHPPEQFAVLLVDPATVAAFEDLAELPHLAGPLVNLNHDDALIDRLRDTLIGELQRRQELLRAAGRAAMRDYEAARAVGSDLPPLPHLLVIIDELDGVLASRPDFADILVALGRLGTNLGIHLLLGLSRYDESLLRGLAPHLSYRVVLRLADAQQSEAALGRPDAHALPRIPGVAYLKAGAAAAQRFTVAHVSGPPRSTAAVAEDAAIPAAAVLPFTASALQLATAPAPAFAAADEDLPSTVRLVVRQLRDQARDRGQRAHQVWLPPLGDPPTLDHLLSAPAADGDRGLASPGWRDQGRLRVPIGLVDKPVQQRRDVFAVDLTGNLVVVGGPQSGKTGLLRALVAAAALTHTPGEIRFYGADLGGGGLARLRDFPHVAAIASRLEPDLVHRLVGEVAELLAERVERFRAAGIGSASAMRELRAAGRLPAETFGDVILVIDGWTALRREFADLEPVVTGIAARGPAYAVHVVLAANRWAHLRPPMRGSFGAWLELRLSDPAESAADRREAANVPAERPGRGLTQERLHFQVALARADGVASAEGLGDALSALARASRAAWPGAGASAPIRPATSPP